MKIEYAAYWSGRDAEEMTDAKVHKLFVELGYKPAWEAPPELIDVDCRPRWRRWLSRVFAQLFRRAKT